MKPLHELLALWRKRAKEFYVRSNASMDNEDAKIDFHIARECDEHAEQLEYAMHLADKGRGTLCVPEGWSYAMKPHEFLRSVVSSSWFSRGASVSTQVAVLQIASMLAAATQPSEAALAGDEK